MQTDGRTEGGKGARGREGERKRVRGRGRAREGEGEKMREGGERINTF